MDAIQSVLQYLPLVAIGIYFLLFDGLLLRGGWRNSAGKYLLAFIGVSTFWQLALHFAPNFNASPNIHFKLLLISTILLTVATVAFRNLSKIEQYRWFLGGGIILIISLLLDQYLPSAILKQDWLSNIDITPTMGGIVAVLGWVMLSMMNISAVFRDADTIKKSWHANRVTVWGYGLIIIFAAGLLILIKPTSDLIGLGGHVLRFVGVGWLIYLATSTRRYDLSSQGRRGLAAAVVALLFALPLTFLIYATATLAPSFPRILLTVAGFLITFFVLFLLRPVRKEFENKIYGQIVGENYNANDVSRRYNQTISRAMELEHLSKLSLQSIDDMIDLSHGCLISVVKQADKYILSPTPGKGHVSLRRGHFHHDSHFMFALDLEQEPVPQYAVDFDEHFRGTADNERAWLKQLGMEIFFPIHTGTELIGILALGPKTNRSTYNSDEIDLFEMLASQTVPAIQNADLFDELNDRNHKVEALYRDLQEKNSQLRSLDRVKSDFLEVASHELRTPLTKVQGYSDILNELSENGSLELNHEQTREMLRQVKKATTELDRMLNSMMDASLVEADALQMTYAPTTIKEIFRRAVTPMSDEIKQRAISLRLRGFGAPLNLIVDSQRLGQAVYNVLHNAVKHTPNGGTVTISASRIPWEGSTDFVKLEIVDEGVGLNLSEQDRIFEKFYRVDDNGSSKEATNNNSGLGLSIAKGIIESHSGRIWVNSVGEDADLMPGSTFYILIPQNARILQDPSRIK